MLVVMDDLALPTGQLRLRPSGSAGGHNGLEDILRALGRDDVPRLRVGIDAPPGRMDPRDYVLGKFDDNEEEIIGVAVREAADAAEDWLFRDMHEVMQRINRKD
jgi:PTH1 family peptidyl-tRNA hydrolase